MHFQAKMSHLYVDQLSSEDAKMYRNSSFVHFKIIELFTEKSFQYCRLAQNQRKFKILFHENSSPRDSNIMTLSARLLVQPPVVVYTALPYTAIARSCFSIDSMTTVAARGVRLATE